MQSVNKITDMLLAKFKHTGFISLIINNAKENRFGGWDVNIVKIRITDYNDKARFLTIQEMIEMFKGQPSLRLGRNTSNRVISKNKFMWLHIDPELKEFENADGDIIRYCPTESFDIVDKASVTKLKQFESDWKVELNKLSENKFKNRFRRERPTEQTETELQIEIDVSDEE